jgi:hypothetical protein
MSAWLRTGVQQMARFGELRRCPPTAGLDWITGIGDTTSTELYRTRLNPIRKGRLRRMRYQACSPAVNAEVAKRDIFATRNPLKSRGRPRLISPQASCRIAKVVARPSIDHARISSPDFGSNRPAKSPSSLHHLCLTSRDFVPSCFLHAGQLSVRSPFVAGVQKPAHCTLPDSCTAAKPSSITTCLAPGYEW